MKPKGNLLIIGGAEDKEASGIPDIAQKNNEFEHYEILKKLLSGSKSKAIEVITTGSKVQEEVRKDYDKVFRKIGFKSVGFIPIKNKTEARENKYIKRAEKAAAIFITGGDQFRLSTILGGTPICEILRA